MKTTLTTENIQAAVDRAEEYLAKAGKNSKDRLRLRLWLEEALLAYRERFGEQCEFGMKLGRSFGNYKIMLTVTGETFDPFAAEDDDEGEGTVLRSFLTNLGQRPVWRYSHRENILQFMLPRKKLSTWASLLLAVGAALVLGLLTRLLPQQVQSVIADGIFSPALDTFIGYLNAVAVPMIFLSVVWGIYSMGDTATFSTMGKRLGGMYLLFLALVAALVAALMLPFFHLNYSTAAEVGGFGALYEMVLDIVPENLFTPFARGNTMQILFVAIVMGVALIIIGEHTQGVAMLAEQLGVLVQCIMELISRLVPFYVFGSLFNLVVSSDFSSLQMGGSFFLATVVGCMIGLLFHTVVVCLRLQLSPVILWKKALPTFFIGLSTSSSAAAFATSLSTCKERFGIRERLANFGVPFGQIIYMPGAFVVFFFASVSVAEYVGTEVSATWIIVSLVMSMILSVATPAVPGGTMASFSVLFTQLGLPMDQLAIVLALNVILDFCHTAANLFGDQCILLLAANKSGMLDKSALNDRTN